MTPKNTSLGKLEIFEVYEYIDGPRLFATRNNIGTMYLVYWFDENKDATGWLYLPISEAKLNRLRRQEITLNTAFRNPETDYYLVYVGVPPRQDSATFVRSSDIELDYLPPKGYYIESADVVNKQTDGWVFETILNGKKTSAEGVSQFVGRFRELIEGLMKHPSGKSPHLYPLSASPGSIKIKFSADNDEAAIESLKVIAQLLQSENREDLQKKLIAYKINPSQLKDFFTSIIRNKLDVQIAPKLAADGNPFELSSERIKQWIKFLDEVEYASIDSSKIPQANDIDKVLEILKMMNDGVALVPENIEGLTTMRQVQYYRAAIYAYGLATQDEQLTAAGRFVISHSDKESQYQILADRFESTDFGWAWMKWAKVEYMTDLDPKTASDFLIASALGLSKVTAKRRASTLEKWLRKLQPYHRRYKTE